MFQVWLFLRGLSADWSCRAGHRIVIWKVVHISPSTPFETRDLVHRFARSKSWEYQEGERQVKSHVLDFGQVARLQLKNNDLDFGKQVADQLRRRLVRLASLPFSADHLDERFNALLALQCCGKVLQTGSQLSNMRKLKDAKYIQNVWQILFLAIYMKNPSVAPAHRWPTCWPWPMRVGSV